jgi:hypothetical protein
MTGTLRQARTATALNVLKRAVNHFSKSFPDPSELESIGYEVINDTLDKPLDDNESWEGYIDITLRNAFRNYMEKYNRLNRGRISMDELNDTGDDTDEELISKILPEKATLKSDYAKGIMDKDRVLKLLNTLPPRQRQAVEQYLEYGEIPPDKMNFSRAIKNLKLDVTK